MFEGDHLAMVERVNQKEKQKRPLGNNIYLEKENV